MVICQHHVPAALHPEKYLGTHWIWRWAWSFLGKRLSKFETRIVQPIVQSLHGLSFDWIRLWRLVSKVLAILFFPLHTLCRQQLVIFPKSISFTFQMSATFVDTYSWEELHSFMKRNKRSEIPGLTKAHLSPILIVSLTHILNLKLIT
jgi:hypothetical protein